MSKRSRTWKRVPVVGCTKGWYSPHGPSGKPGVPRVLPCRVSDRWWRRNCDAESGSYLDGGRGGSDELSAKMPTWAACGGSTTASRWEQRCSWTSSPHECKEQPESQHHRFLVDGRAPPRRPLLTVRVALQVRLVEALDVVVVQPEERRERRAERRHHAADGAVHAVVRRLDRRLAVAACVGLAPASSNAVQSAIGRRGG